jgi:hypothetical protein
MAYMKKPFKFELAGKPMKDNVTKRLNAQTHMPLSNNANVTEKPLHEFAEQRSSKMHTKDTGQATLYVDLLTTASCRPMGICCTLSQTAAASARLAAHSHAPEDSDEHQSADRIYT